MELVVFIAGGGELVHQGLEVVNGVYGDIRGGVLVDGDTGEAVRLGQTEDVAVFQCLRRMTHEMFDVHSFCTGGAGRAGPGLLVLRRKSLEKNVSPAPVLETVREVYMRLVVLEGSLASRPEELELKSRCSLAATPDVQLC